MMPRSLAPVGFPCFVLAMAFTLTPTHANATVPAKPTLSCPESIAVEQRATAAVPGWSALSREAPHQLRGVTLYWGHPSHLASLVPDVEEPRPGGMVGVVWKLTAGAEAYWMECAYRSTDVVLYREVPRQATRCEFVTNPKLLFDGAAALVSTRCE